MNAYQLYVEQCINGWVVTAGQGESFGRSPVGAVVVKVISSNLGTALVQIADEILKHAEKPKEQQG